MNKLSIEQKLLLLAIINISVWLFNGIVWIVIKKNNPDYGESMLAYNLIMTQMGVGISILSVFTILYKEIISFLVLIFQPYMSVFWAILASIIFLIPIVTEVVSFPSGSTTMALAAKICVILGILTPLWFLLQKEFRIIAAICVFAIGTIGTLVFTLSYKSPIINPENILYYIFTFVIVAISGLLEIDDFRSSKRKSVN